MTIDRLGLEMYHDGELDGAAAARLGERLRADAGARAQLREVARLDAVIRAGLVSEPATRGARWPARLGWLAAAVVGMAVLGRWAWTGAAPVATTPTPAVAERATPSGLRVIASFPAMAGWVAPTPEAPQAPADLGVLEGLLAGGDAGSALAFIRGLEGAERDAALVRLGRARVAANTSRTILDSLPPTVQVSACRVWAEEPALRPVAFERLAALRHDPGVGESARSLIKELSERRDLLAWVRSYLGKDPA